MFHVKHSTTRRRPTTRRSQPRPPINHHPAQCGTWPPAPAPPPTPTTAVRCPPVDRRPRRGRRPRRRPHPPGSRPPTTARRQPSTTCRPHRPLLAPPTRKAPKILLRGFSRYSQRRQPALSPQCATPPGRPGRPRRGRRSQTRPLAAPSDPRRCPRPTWPCASCRCSRWPRPSRGPCQPRA